MQAGLDRSIGHHGHGFRVNVSVSNLVGKLVDLQFNNLLCLAVFLLSTLAFHELDLSGPLVTGLAFGLLVCSGSAVVLGLPG